jgi:hypothetical protein
VNKGDRDLASSCCREQMATYLKTSKRDCGHQDITGRISEAMSQSGDMFFEGWEHGRKPGEEDTKRRDKAELDQGEGRRLGEGIEDGFRGGVRQGTGKVPN